MHMASKSPGSNLSCRSSATSRCANRASFLLIKFYATPSTAGPTFIMRPYSTFFKCSQSQQLFVLKLNMQPHMDDLKQQHVLLFQQYDQLYLRADIIGKQFQECRKRLEILSESGNQKQYEEQCLIYEQLHAKMCEFPKQFKIINPKVFSVKLQMARKKLAQLQSEQAMLDATNNRSYKDFAQLKSMSSSDYEDMIQTRAKFRCLQIKREKQRIAVYGKAVASGSLPEWDLKSQQSEVNNHST